MTNTYQIQAWCARPFTSWITVQAATPEEALAQARLKDDALIDAAEECNTGYPWNVFAVFDQGGTAVLHSPEAEGLQQEDATDVVNQQRLVFQELLTAAEDLLAAIKDATDQFDNECIRLDASCETARTVFQSSGRFDIHKLLARRREIALIWSVEDVLQKRPDLTEEQAWEVLQDVQGGHDAEYGVSWVTLDCVADDLFGPAPETDEG